MQRRIFFFIFFIFFSFFPSEIFSEEIIHRVKKGETLYSIALFYGVSIDALMKANKISDPSKLRMDQKLKIPEKLAFQPPESAKPPKETPPADYVEYTVVKGDTLFGIARKNNISESELRKANGFSVSHILKIGEKLKIPSEKSVSNPPNSPPPVKKSDDPPKPSKIEWPVAVKKIEKADGKLAGGVIITSYAAEPVRSLTKGVVKSAGPYFNFKNVVIVQSKDGYLYTYGGCGRLSVKVGDQVGAGTELGKLDTTRDPQLLLMVSQNNKPVDPETAPRD